MRLVMIAPFPPPVIGASNVTQAVYEAVKSRGVDVRKFPISVSRTGHAKGLAYHVQRAYANFAALFGLIIACGRNAKAYIVPGGGRGVYYTLLQVMAGTLCYRQIVFHHHSSLYAKVAVAGMRATVALTRKKGLHVFLSEGMAQDFQRLYGQVNYLVATNAYVVAGELADQVVSSGISAIRIGYLSNFSREKGFFLVVALFEELLHRAADVELHLAGTAIDAEVREALGRLLEAHPERVRYAGPLYGDDKTEFYRELDVFVFPSLYPQEAQPLVVYEAVAAGLKVIATPAGYIPEMVNCLMGEASQTSEEFVSFAASTILKMAAEPQAAEAGKRQRLALMKRETERSLAQYEALYDLLAG